MVRSGWIHSRVGFDGRVRSGGGSVMEDLDVAENGGVSVGAGGKVAAMHEFVLQAAPERFHEGIIVAVTPAARPRKS